MNSSSEHFEAIIPPPCSDWRYLPYHWDSLMRLLGNRVRYGHKGVLVIQGLEAVAIHTLEIQPPSIAVVSNRELWRGQLKGPFPKFEPLLTMALSSLVFGAFLRFSWRLQSPVGKRVIS